MKLIHIAFIGVTALSIGACGSSDNDNESTGTATTEVSSLEITSVSGVTVALNGTWSRPCITETTDTRNTHSYEDNTVTINNMEYASNDGSCSGTPMNTTTYNLTAETGSNTAITGWKDGMENPMTAPSSQDGTGSLSDTENITPINLTAVSGPGLTPGDTFTWFYVADDTGNTTTLYSGEINNTTSILAEGFDALTPYAMP